MFFKSQIEFSKIFTIRTLPIINNYIFRVARNYHFRTTVTIFPEIPAVRVSEIPAIIFSETAAIIISEILAIQISNISTIVHFRDTCNYKCLTCWQVYFFKCQQL